MAAVGLPHDFFIAMTVLELLIPGFMAFAQSPHHASDLNMPGALTAAIIAGGQGSRLAGHDKALIQLGGVKQLERLLEALRPQTDRQILISNRDPHSYAPFGLPVVADAWPGQPGPLAGIYTALQYCGSGDVLCVPVDAITLPQDLAARLRAARRASGAAVACVHDGVGLQPVCCLLPASLAASAREALAGGEFALHRWLQICGLATADFSDHPRWAWSVNTFEEYREAQMRLDET